MEEQSKLAENGNKNDRHILFILLFLPCLFIRRVLDNDTWFLLNSGRYVMEHGIPYIETFSIHKNMEFVMQQWLTDVIFWNVYDKFGENGLFLIVMVCYAIIIFLMYKLTMKVSNENFFVSFVITLLSSILIYIYMVTRPTIFTLIMVLIELNALENFISSENNKYLFILPVLSLFMINMHAALWPILFVLILPYIIDSFDIKIGFIIGEGYKKKYFLLAVVSMFMIALINPYGIKAMTYLIKSTGYPEMNNIIEIKPPYVNNVVGALTYICISFISFIYIFYRKGKTKIRYFLLTIGTMYMALTSIRNVTYFALCSLFPLSYYLKDYKIKSFIVPDKKNNNLRTILVILIIIVIYIGVYYNSFDNTTYESYLDLNSAVDYILLNENVDENILYTGFNSGSLVQFRGLRTYIDPRAEVYFKKHNNIDDIYNEYFDLQKGRIFYKDVLNKYQFTHLLVTKDDLLYAYLPKDVDYIKVYENETYFVYKKIN